MFYIVHTFVFIRPFPCHVKLLNNQEAKLLESQEAKLLYNCEAFVSLNVNHPQNKCI